MTASEGPHIPTQNTHSHPSRKASYRGARVPMFPRIPKHKTSKRTRTQSCRKASYHNARVLMFLEEWLN